MAKTLSPSALAVKHASRDFFATMREEKGQASRVRVVAAAAKEKTVNYTPEQTAELVAAYVADSTEATVSAFAEKLGKTTRSIVAKLSREGVYKIGRAHV